MEDVHQEIALYKFCLAVKYSVGGCPDVQSFCFFTVYLIISFSVAADLYSKYVCIPFYVHR